jgi:SAM-dependent methyltransferase
MQAYDRHFFLAQREGARGSARRVVPLVVDWVRPQHVVDVGCGTGTWLSVFRECGVEDIWGIDGEYVLDWLETPRERFLPHDLRIPLKLDRQFDLVVSLEVAEHLPAECADGFVESLATLGPVVLFSAAIPFQGGTSHLNEQWPEYWAARFNRHGYAVIDALRPRIWLDPEVEWWYAQNMLLFVRRGALPAYPSLLHELERTSPARLSIVHPKKYLEMVEWTHRIELTRQDIARVVPVDAPLILVDEEQLGAAVASDRRAVPFPERDGQYWGPPPDDDTAIRELERLRSAGARFVVVAWPAFWWLDHYAGLSRHLRSRFRPLLENDRVIVFEQAEGSEAR